MALISKLRAVDRLPRRLCQLYAGLTLYGVSLAMQVEATLGLDPWDVFHQGVSKQTGISLGWIVNIVGALVLLLWIPLRQRPGLGTISNVLVIGTVTDLTLPLLPTPDDFSARWALLIAAVVLNGMATGLYIGARLGPGPRDGLMVGLAARGWSIRWARTLVEITVLVIGFLLGGTVGAGTIVYALGIGPLSQLFLQLFTVPESRTPTDSGREAALSSKSA